MAKRCCRIYDFLIIDATAPEFSLILCSAYLQPELLYLLLAADLLDHAAEAS